MATLNLGRIKFNWRGTYNPATAYTADDVVGYLGTSYVSVAASTGVTPGTDATKWQTMAQGSDLSVLTTQGDLPYRGSSGVSRLPAGTAGFLLQTQGSGANPTWVSSAFLARPAETVAAFPDDRTKGDYFAAVITNSGELQTIGKSDRGQTGQGIGHSVTSAGSGNNFNVAQLPDGKEALRVIMGKDRMFVITTDYRLYATGNNSNGSLGLGLSSSSSGPSGTPFADTTDRSILTEVIFPESNYPSGGNTSRPEIIDVFTSSHDLNHDSTFAIDKNGQLWAWGNNANSRLGLGSADTTVRYAPCRVPAFIGSDITANAVQGQNVGALSSGSRKKVRTVLFDDCANAFYAITEPGDENLVAGSNLYFWGANLNGLFSNGSTSGTQDTPSNLNRTLLNLATGAFIIDGTIRANGTSAGTGANLVNQTYALLLTSTGEIWGVGFNTSGEIGDGTSVSKSQFVNVAAPVGTWATPSFTFNWGDTASLQSDFRKFQTTMVSRQGATFARLSNGSWRCWGDNASSILGQGTSTDVLNPSTFSLAHWDSLRTGQNLPSTSGGYYGAAASVPSSNYTTAFGTTISKVCLGGLGTTATVILLMSNGDIYTCGYAARGACGNVSWPNASVTARWGAAAAEWQYSRIFRKVPLNVKCSGNNVLDVFMAGHTICVAQLLLTNGELYACGYSGAQTVDTYSNTTSGDGFVGARMTTSALAGTAYVACGTVNTFTRVAIGQ